MIFPQLAEMLQSDCQFVVIGKSMDNAARLNVSHNALVSSQTWMTRKFRGWYCGRNEAQPSESTTNFDTVLTNIVVDKA